MSLDVIVPVRPRVGDRANPALTRAIELCFDTAQITSACADACLDESDMADYRAVVQLSLDCAELCNATGEMASRSAGASTPMVLQLLQGAANMASACAAECDRHSDRNPECAVCARRCRECAEACMVAAVSLLN